LREPRSGDQLTEKSPASQAPFIKMGLISQGSQNLALGLTTAAASQLDESLIEPLSRSLPLAVL